MLLYLSVFGGCFCPLRFPHNRNNKTFVTQLNFQNPFHNQSENKYFTRSIQDCIPPANIDRINVVYCHGACTLAMHVAPGHACPPAIAHPPCHACPLDHTCPPAMHAPLPPAMHALNTPNPCPPPCMPPCHTLPLDRILDTRFCKILPYPNFVAGG